MKPNQWRPEGADRTLTPPPVGAVIAFDHAAWVVLASSPEPADAWDARDLALIQRHGPTAAPATLTIRPAELDHGQAHDATDRRLRYWPGATAWWVYPDRHYPMCGSCRQPQPCREKTAARRAEFEFRAAERYSRPGICPACNEPVTPTQQARAFPENAIWPLGPTPVRFHARRPACAAEADRYARLRPNSQPHQ